MGVTVPSQERLDEMSIEDLNYEYRVLLERNRLENENRWKDYIQIGKNIVEIMKDDPSLKEKLLVGVSGDIRDFMNHHL
jgi:hypothetical protein